MEKNIETDNQGSYVVEYMQEITPAFIKDTTIYVYELNIDFNEIMQEIYSKYKVKQSLYKVNSLEKIPSNITKLYDEYGFYIRKNKIYSLSKSIDETITSIVDILEERIYSFIDREIENLEPLEITIEDVFNNIEISQSEVSLTELEYLKEEDENLFKNLLKAKFTLNTCSKPFKIPYRVSDKGAEAFILDKKNNKHAVSYRELNFIPIYGKSGEMFSDEFIENKKGKAVIKLKADVIKKKESLFFKYTMIFSEIIKNPVEYTDLFAKAWKDYHTLCPGIKNREKRTFYFRKKQGYVPIKLRRVYSRDSNDSEFYKDLKFTYEHEDFDLMSQIEKVFGYDLKKINDILQTEGTESKIFLQNWSKASREKVFKGSGLTYHDKYYIAQHIKETNIYLKDFKKYRPIAIKDTKYAQKLGISKSGSTATKDNGVVFEKTMLRNPNTKDINLYIFKDSTQEYDVDIVDCVKSMFFSPESTIKANLNNSILHKIERYNLLNEELQNNEKLKDSEIEDKIKKINALELDIQKTITLQVKNIESEKNKLSKLKNSMEDLDYKFKVIDSDGKKKEINIHLNIIDSEEVLEQYLKGESVEDRIEVIKESVGGAFKENAIALIELENLGNENDAKAIIRESFNSMGIINQFINPMSFQYSNNNSNKVIIDYDFKNKVFEYEDFKYLQDEKVNEYSNKVRKAILDLLVDIGFTDSTFSLNENNMYSFGILDLSNYRQLKNVINIDDELDEEDIDEKEKILSIEEDGIYIPIICRMNDKTIETKILLDNVENNNFNTWQHISKLPQILNNLKEESKDCDFLEESNLDKKIKLSEVFYKVANFIDNEQEDNKILLLSNTNCGKLNHQTYKNIFTSIIKNTSLIFLDVEDTHYSIINQDMTDEETGLVSFSQPANFLYQVDENTFKAIGQKPKGIKANQFLYSRMNPSTQFKCRKLFTIEILSNKTNLKNEELAYLTHRTRTSLTTEIHLNIDILTEYIYSSLKKVFI